MRFPTKWMAILAVGAAFGAAVVDASAGDGAKGEGRGRGAGFDRGDVRRGRFGRRAFLRERIRHVRQERAALLRSLGVTPDQQRVALEKSRAAQPIVAEARRELAQVRVQSGDAKPTDPAAREARRNAVRDLRHRTAEKLAPLAKDVIATLTPEQRAKLEGFAAAHGRTFDEARLTKRISRWLARPMTAAKLEARLGTK